MPPRGRCWHGGSSRRRHNRPALHFSPFSPKPLAVPPPPDPVTLALDTQLDGLLSEFAFLVPQERFCYRRNGAWATDELVGKEGIAHHLVSLGCSVDDAAAILRAKAYRAAYGFDRIPNQGPIAAIQGRCYLNSWRPPALTPAPGPYPTIERLLDWTTAGDVAGQLWLTHWLAAKAQDAAFVPKIAVVLAGQPGSGKGTLALILATILGRENCVTIGREALDSRFNARWADKLFVLADEVVTNENVRSNAERLKQLIDASEIELEAKGKDQRTSKNRIAWLFASNDDVAPVIVERGDRRYSVFTNHNTIPPTYKALLDGSFEADRESPTAAFRAEIAAFAYDLLALEVDRALIARPYENAAREELITASLPSHRIFIEEVNARGLDAVIAELYHDYHPFLQSRNKWDYGAEGVAYEAGLYQIYAEFCEQRGMHPLKANKLGVALKNRPDRWPHTRIYASDGRRAWVYCVPRTPAALGPNTTHASNTAAPDHPPAST